MEAVDLTTPPTMVMAAAERPSIVPDPMTTLIL
jgi:hypothetical protein